MFDEFMGKDVYTADPKRMTACLDGELSLPLVDESHTPVASSPRKNS